MWDVHSEVEEDEVRLELVLGRDGFVERGHHPDLAELDENQGEHEYRLGIVRDDENSVGHRLAEWPPSTSSRGDSRHAVIKVTGFGRGQWRQGPVRSAARSWPGAIRRPGRPSWRRRSLPTCPAVTGPTQGPPRPRSCHGLRRWDGGRHAAAGSVQGAGFETRGPCGANPRCPAARRRLR